MVTRTFENTSMEDLDSHLPSRFNNATPPDIKEKEFVNVFVYGSLLKGFGNHVLLTRSELLGEYVTANRYRMVSFGFYPAVEHPEEDILDDMPSSKAMSNSKYRPVAGEIYKVNKDTLRSLDALEGNGFFYEREHIPVLGFKEKVWMYILVRSGSKNPLVATDESRNFSWHSERDRRAF